MSSTHHASGSLLVLFLLGKTNFPTETPKLTDTVITVEDLFLIPSTIYKFFTEFGLFLWRRHRLKRHKAISNLQNTFSAVYFLPNTYILKPLCSYQNLYFWKKNWQKLVFLVIISESVAWLQNLILQYSARYRTLL